MTIESINKLNIMVGSDPEVLVITDAPNDSFWGSGMVMSNRAMKLFGKYAKSHGFTKENFIFVSPCPPIPEIAQGSERRIGDYIEGYRDSLCDLIEKYSDRVRAVVVMGKIGNRQLRGKSVAITKVRGVFTTSDITGSIPVLPVLGAGHVLTRPENEELFASDIGILGSLKKCNWSIEQYKNLCEVGEYKWAFDFSELMESPPKVISLDCETLGVDWFRDEFKVITISITTEVGKAIVVPVDLEYFNNAELRGVYNEGMGMLTQSHIEDTKAQLRVLLSDPNTFTFGHNLKFDIHALSTLDINITNWYADTMQLAFAADDNMVSKSLTNSVKRWVPEMAGYSDEFDSTTDKSRMDLVTHDDMLIYAGGDTDATYRLAQVLIPLVRKDDRNWQTFLKVQMPTLRAFVGIEKNGLLVDRDKLDEVRKFLILREKETYNELIDLTPDAVLREHEGNWSFSSPAFTRDILFGKSGLKLKPRVFTQSTKNLPKEERVPSISSGSHLPYFDEVPFVQKLMQYSKLTKMLNTYVGSDGHSNSELVIRNKDGSVPNKVNKYLLAAGINLPPSKALRARSPLKTDLFQSELPCSICATKNKVIDVDINGNVSLRSLSSASGFYQHIKDSNVIHSSFILHRTSTGRSASNNPNLQNIPKRGELAKQFRKIFIPEEGYVLMEADLSQAEIRCSAWAANDKELTKIYKEEGDVHSYTASVIMGVSYEEFVAARSDKTKLLEVFPDWEGAGVYLKTFGEEARGYVTLADFADFKRYQAKAVNFGFLYGMSAGGFRVYAKLDYGLELSAKEANKIREEFFNRYSGLLGWHKGVEKFVKKTGYVRASHGALRRLPSINSDEEGVQSGAVRQAVNSPIQRFASDLGLMALHRIFRDCPKDSVKPIMFIHDAVVLMVRKDKVEETAAGVKYYMENTPLESWFGIECPFPILADVSVGDNLGEMEELDVDSAKPSWYQSGMIKPESMDAEDWDTACSRGYITCD